MALICWEIVGCILLADFLSGFGHWFEDAYSVPTWPLLGKLIAEPNIEHHLHPQQMGETFWVRNIYQVLPMSMLILVIHLFGYLYWQVGLVLILTSFSNETHSWCHNKAQNRLVLLLQEMGIVISPKQHGKHHHLPYNQRFCVITNFVNPIVDQIHLWSLLEKTISIIGITPKRLSPERSFV